MVVQSAYMPGIPDYTVTGKFRAGEGGIWIDQRDIHQVINDGDEPFVFIEIQYGDCDENDIVRLEDHYGRITDQKK